MALVPFVLSLSTAAMEGSPSFPSTMQNVDETNRNFDHHPDY